MLDSKVSEQFYPPKWMDIALGEADAVRRQACGLNGRRRTRMQSPGVEPCIPYWLH